MGHRPAPASATTQLVVRRGTSRTVYNDFGRKFILTHNNSLAPASTVAAVPVRVVCIVLCDTSC